MDSALIIVENVHKEYRGIAPWSARTQALQGISFVVPRGSILGLLGPNGAGKSTTLHLLLGLLAPTKGTIIVGGFPSSSPCARRSVGFLPESFAFDRFVSGRRLLERFDVLSRNEPATRVRRVEEVLRMARLHGDSGRRVGSYSKGMTQRIGLAQALLGDPELLVLDEPMSGMDPATRRAVKDLLLERKQRGKTVLFSSHILSDVEEIADYVVILSNGRVAASAEMTELRGRSPAVRIVFRPSAGSMVLELGGVFEASPAATGDADVFAVEVEGEVGVQRALEALNASRAQVLSVAPIRSSLEALFLRLTDRKDEEART